MYEVFDNFLGTGTWHTPHPLDARRFNIALETIIRNKLFNEDDMSAYMRTKLGLRGDTPLVEDTRRLAAKAGAIRDFLRDTDQM